MEKRIETSALIAVKIIEGLYGKITTMERCWDIIEECWDFGNLDVETDRKQREEILLALDVDTVKTELQRRYNALREDGEYFPNLEPYEVDEIVMWANHSFIHP